VLKKVMIALSLLLLAVAGAAAQQAAIKRTVLQKTDVPGSSYEAVFAMAELPAGVLVGRHTHPGTEQGTVIEGETTLLVEGQADKVMKSGDSWLIPAGVAHDAKAGSGGAKVIVVYIVEKGKPLATPAPK
jgi:quercetin dioxygenase-like cupin family protein